MLEIKNLKKYFGGVKAVDDCSFKIKKRKITSLIGPNGSGKSTIFNLISRIVDEDGGKIFFEGVNITNFSPEKVANVGISRLFQKSQLFDNLTVKENLLLAVNNEDTKFLKNLFGQNNLELEKKKCVEDILKDIEMKRFENKLCKDLSYGQKRLVEIARTILKPHKLLILDEPVAGVNPKLRKKISRILMGLKKKGSTILLIEHDMDFAFKLSNKIIVLDEGKVIAEDKPQKIKNNKEVLEVYFGS